MSLSIHVLKEHLVLTFFRLSSSIAIQIVHIMLVGATVEHVSGEQLTIYFLMREN